MILIAIYLSIKFNYSIRKNCFATRRRTSEHERISSQIENQS